MNAMFAKVSTALVAVVLSVTHAAADCPWYSSSCSSVPEIDGTAGIMAMALVASIMGLVYNRARKP